MMEKDQSTMHTARHRLQLFRKALLWQLAVWLLVGIVLFLPAGTLSWPAGWIFFVFFFGFVGWLSIWLSRGNPSLLKERLQILSPDQKFDDKVWLIVFYTLSLLWLALMPFEAVRLHWSHMPSWVPTVGLLLFLCTLAGIFVTLRENPYLSPVVRIQRGQTVISSGPYHAIRHPLYAVASLFYLSVPLLLGSWAGFALAPLFISLMIYRAVQEEHLLRENLPGYRAYMGKVLFRFIPGIW